jgi:hypothetical protein
MTIEKVETITDEKWRASGVYEGVYFYIFGKTRNEVLGRVYDILKRYGR